MVQEGAGLPPSNSVHHGPVIREIYFRTPKWWARWTWPLVMGIAIWSAVGAQTAFYHWTQRVDAASDVPPDKNGTAAADSGTSTKTKWEPRPFYQRALMSGSILAFGTGLGILFLSTRSRIVRRLYFVSRPSPFQRNFQPQQKITNDARQSEFPYVLVETVTNTSGKGKIFLKKDCELHPGSDDTEMVLKVPGTRMFWLGLKEAIIDGEPVTQGVRAVRQKLIETWSGKKNNDSGGRWVRGPIVEAGS